MYSLDAWDLFVEFMDCPFNKKQMEKEECFWLSSKPSNYQHVYMLLCGWIDVDLYSPVWMDILCSSA